MCIIPLTFIAVPWWVTPGQCVQVIAFLGFEWCTCVLAEHQRSIPMTSAVEVQYTAFIIIFNPAITAARMACHTPRGTNYPDPKHVRLEAMETLSKQNVCSSDTDE